MIATLSPWMLALVAAFVLIVPCLWFLDAFGDKSQKTNSTTSLYENSFNSSSSKIESLDGSTNITLGGGESSSSGTSGTTV